MRFSHLIILILVISSCVRSLDINKAYRPLIGLQPLDGFEKTLMDSISHSLKNTYGYRVVILQDQKLPLRAFVKIKSPRYRADTLLKYLSRIKPDSLDFIMGLTTKDISTTKRDKKGYIKQPESKYLDWGIFGLGLKPGRTCVVSSCRIYNKDHAKFIDRLTKVCVHEFGHNLGLKHCPNEKCVMQDALETITTIDSGSINLCTDCKRQINIVEN